jgi:hypothetical protein
MAISSTQRDTVAAFVVPFIIYGLLVITVAKIPAVIHLELGFKFYALTAEIVGFVFLTRRFEYWAAPLAILYFPAMYGALFIFTFAAACAFGNCL